jgi:hypothetical protein
VGQLRSFNCYADGRNKGFCVHCGGPYETDDHVPSKVLLDEPYPDNLIVCPSCLKCNNDLSADETYLACLLECVIAGEALPSMLRRTKIANVLEHNEALLKRLEHARTDGEAGKIWHVENDRVRAVLLKLARGHAAYEHNQPQLQEPDYVDFRPLSAMNENERAAFEGAEEGGLAAWPEVGSRAMQRLLIVDADVFSEGWVTVQDRNYRFHVSDENGMAVRIVLREYLACQVVWE